jgi:hypothetical protein
MEGLWNVSSRCFRNSCDEGVDHCWPTSPRAVSATDARRIVRLANRTVRFVVRVPALQFSGSVALLAGEAWRGSAWASPAPGFGSLGQGSSRVKSFAKKKSSLRKTSNSGSKPRFGEGSTARLSRSVQGATREVTDSRDVRCVRDLARVVADRVDEQSRELDPG